MAYALNVDLIEEQAGQCVIKMSLTFWGHSVAECEQTWSSLKQKFDFFAAAEREDRTVEELEEIDEDELPEAECEEEDER